jgi:hypothetical protein
VAFCEFMCSKPGLSSRQTPSPRHGLSADTHGAPSRPSLLHCRFESTVTASQRWAVHCHLIRVYMPVRCLCAWSSSLIYRHVMCGSRSHAGSFHACNCKVASAPHLRASTGEPYVNGALANKLDLALLTRNSRRSRRAGNAVAWGLASASAGSCTGGSDRLHHYHFHQKKREASLPNRCNKFWSYVQVKKNAVALLIKGCGPILTAVRP